RALAPCLGGDQAWLLVDHDPLLIATQAAVLSDWARRHGWRCEEIDGGVAIESETGRWRARALVFDLAANLEDIDFAACDGVTTSAFLDLVSASWLDRLCATLMPYHLPLLAEL